jgi:hypothetical protein
MVWLVADPWFDRFIMFVILVNSIELAIYDFKSEKKCDYEHEHSSAQCKNTHMN